MRLNTAGCSHTALGLERQTQPLGSWHVRLGKLARFAFANTISITDRVMPTFSVTLKRFYACIAASIGY